MTKEARTKKPRAAAIRRWIRRGFLVWAIVSTLWLANSVRTQGVDPATLRSSPNITVVDRATTLEFLPVTEKRDTALIFICGSGVSANAYAPLLRPVAEAGYSVFVVKLPWRFAPLESHKQSAVDSALGLIPAHPGFSRWVISGHSLGAALSCRAAQANPTSFSAMVLFGTTHPKHDDLSFLKIPVTKVYASSDGIAPPETVLANQRLLPAHTRWVEIKGGNHSQFGHYGRQLFDGTATISRVEQQKVARSALLEAINEVEGAEQSHAPEPAARPVSNGESVTPGPVNAESGNERLMIVLP
jgi:pimeloyl-ACP methyl ester carboxylesterase